MVVLLSTTIWANLAHAQCATLPTIPEEVTDGDWFGYEIDVSGSRAAVGARNDSTLATNAGAVYIMEQDVDGWQTAQKLLPDDGAENDFFGQALALDGDLLAIGAPGADGSGTDIGAVYVFRFSGVEWVQEARIDSQITERDGQLFGAAVALQGDQLFIGAPAGNDIRGRTYFYEFDGAAWTRTTELLPEDVEANDAFGNSIAISGPNIVIGARDQDEVKGAAYVYNYDGVEWLQTDKLTATEPVAGDMFAFDVAIDGLTIVCGARNEKEGRGGAYVFAFDGELWLEEQRLRPAAPRPNDSFGIGVDVDGPTILVGAIRYDDSATNGGAAFRFKHDGETWGDITKIFSTNPSANAGFGRSVALTTDWTIIGSYRDDTETLTDAGAVYFYEVPAPEFDCNDSQICDDDEILSGSVEDCNENLIPDECDALSGFSEDCNENLIPDDCEVEDGSVPDCNENGIPDSCDIESGFSTDCNENGVPDFCDVDAGTSEDCDGNEYPDECDAAYFIANSGNYSPLGDNIVHEFIIPDIYPAGRPVTITIKARGDLNALAEFVTLFLNGNEIGMVFSETGSDCPTAVDTAIIELHPEEFNPHLSGTDALFELVPSGVVDASLCEDSLIRMTVEYQPSTENDCNANGIPDICDLLSGVLTDDNGDGVPDECETCNADFNGDGNINTLDFLAFLNAFNNGEPEADFNGDGSINTLDFLAFLNTYNAGCP